MVTLPSSLSTGLTFATRQLEARGRSRAEAARVVVSKAPKGVGCGEGVSPSPVSTGENFWTFEWKMARFGAFLALFMQTAVI